MWIFYSLVHSESLQEPELGQGRARNSIPGLPTWVAVAQELPRHIGRMVQPGLELLP